jgi:hypothetical protein
MTGGAPTIADQVLALQTLDVPALVARYERVFGQAPHCRNRIWLWRNVAWKIQEQTLGGLSPEARARLEQLVSEIRLPTEPPPKIARVRVNKRRVQSVLAPGTTLARTWHGRELRVTVLDRGFEHDGVVYRSLSAVARGITGTNWNGHLFFGLRPRRTDA